MSRYYKIVVGQETGAPLGGGVASNNNGATWTNMVNGRLDLGAPDIELEVWAASFDAFIAQAAVRIWGPTKAQMSQASDFNGAPIQVYAGMQKGLPIATRQASQAGLIASGVIFQAYGNWQGTVQTLDFIISTDGGATQSKPANILLNAMKGQSLTDAVQQALQVAYPGYRVTTQVMTNLVLPQDEHHVPQTLQQFSTYVQGLSQNLVSDPTYQGIKITLQDKTFTVYDSPVGDTIRLAVEDMIGQPTWLSPYTVSFSTVLRADITVGSKINFPLLAGQRAVTTPQSGSFARSKVAFDGTWTINNVRHVGRARAADPQSWVSNYQAYSNLALSDELAVGSTGA